MQTEEEAKKAIEAATAPAPVAAPAKAVRPKKLGRPKKNGVAIPVEVTGVITEPINPGDTVEMIYGAPIMFKKLFALLKGYVVSEVELSFDQNGLRIETMDRVRKVRIIQNISGACMNTYYCKAPVRVWVKRMDLDRVFSNLTANEYKVTWLLNENHKHILYVIVKGAKYSTDNIFEIDVNYKEAQDNLLRDDDTNYPVKFKISIPYLKKQINSVSKTAKVLTIQKTGDDPLQLTVGKTQTSNVGWIEVYNDAAGIDLQSTIKATDIFNVSVEIPNILPFCKYAIGEDAYIAADKTERISFQCFADKKEHGWAASVKIFSEIIKTPGGK
jgi:hypothetical protein